MNHSQCRGQVNTPATASAASAVPVDPNSLSKNMNLATLQHMTTPEFVCQAFFLGTPWIWKNALSPAY
jgi:hypothetical protein